MQAAVCDSCFTLQHFGNASIPHLGVQPSSNVAQEAQRKGVNVLEEFFNLEVAERIKEEVLDLKHQETYVHFRERCEISRERLIDQL